MFRKIRNFILGFGLLLQMADFPGIAQTTPPSEYQLKAAFIYNFAKFIDWPPDAFAGEKSPFVIGILGENPFGKSLEDLVANKSINTHPISIKTCRDAADATGCHLIFISNPAKEKIPDIIKKLEGFSVLTVGETEHFTASGGMINFVTDGKKVRFQINEVAAKAAKLRMSSKLLSLAIPSNP